MPDSLNPPNPTTPGSAPYERLLDAARALVPKLRERAQATEDARQLLEETERDMHDAGLFRIMQPQRIGGAELDYVALCDFGEVLAQGCASSAWTCVNMVSHHWMMAMFSEKAQNEIWKDSDVLIGSALVFPCGKARREAGGYVLSGRWPFSSGIDPCTWNMVAAIVEPDDDHPEPEYRIFLLHKRDYEIIDTWHTMALRGTGSKDVACKDVAVTEPFTVAVSALSGGRTPGSDLNPSALYRVPVFALFPYGLTGIAVGNAQGVCDDFVASAKSRASRYSGAKISEMQTTHIKIGEATARVNAARETTRSVCIKAMDNARVGIATDMNEKVRYRREAVFGVGLCTEAVDMLFAASGGGGLYTRNHLQRAFRDAHAISAHIAFNPDVAHAAYGRVVLGLDSGNPTL